MEKYESYKPSGIDWLGDIPQKWSVKKLKFLARILNGQDHKGVWDENGEYPIIGTGGEFGRANQYLHNRPSVILGRKGTIDKPQYIDEPFWPVDTAYYTDILEHTNPRFFYYCCKTIRFDLYRYGSAVPSMTQETLSQVPFAAPPLTEQNTIATYLDRKTEEIVKLIANKQKLIELLKEERTAIINKAVTKGINPDAKLKPSGIDWLGDIPEHWITKRLKYLSDIKTGGRNTEDRLPDGEYAFFVRSQEVERIDTYSFDGEAILTAGDGVGVAKVFHYFNGKFDCHQRVYRLTNFREVEGKLLFHYLKANLVKEILRFNAKSTVDSLRLPMFQNFVIAFPQESTEQVKIRDFIETKSDEVEATISKIKREIELMREYRTALISEVVTGKIKVV